MFTNIPGPGQEFKNQTTTFSTLPANGNETGDVRTVQDTGIPYYWNGSFWQLISAAPPSGISSINGNLSPGQILVGGHGISIFTVSGTTTISNIRVTTTDSPALNDIVIFSNPDSITGSSALVYDGDTLTITGNSSSMGLYLSGNFGSNNPINMGIANGLWTSREGDIITYIYNTPEIGHLGFIDKSGSSGYTNYEFTYRTANPSKMAFGNGIDIDLIVFNHLPATNQFLLQMNPDGQIIASICAQNGNINFPAYTFNSEQTTGIYLVPNGVNPEPTIYFSGPGNLGGAPGVYVNGLVGSQGSGGGGFFGNGYISPDITGSMAFYYDPISIAIRVVINDGASYSAFFNDDGDLLFSNQDQVTPINSNIGDALGHAPISLFVGQNGIHLQSLSGSNNSCGTATLVAGTVIVSNGLIVTNTQIILSIKTISGIPGFLSTTRVNGTSFTINSTSNSDTSTIEWLLIERF